MQSGHRIGTRLHSERAGFLDADGTTAWSLMECSRLSSRSCLSEPRIAARLCAVPVSPAWRSTWRNATVHAAFALRAALRQDGRSAEVPRTGTGLGATAVGRRGACGEEMPIVVPSQSARCFTIALGLPLSLSLSLYTRKIRLAFAVIGTSPLQGARCSTAVSNVGLRCCRNSCRDSRPR